MNSEAKRERKRGGTETRERKRKRGEEENGGVRRFLIFSQIFIASSQF